MDPILKIFPLISIHCKHIETQGPVQYIILGWNT